MQLDPSIDVLALVQVVALGTGTLLLVESHFAIIFVLR